MNKFILLIFTVIAVSFVLVIFFKWFERSSIYYPTKFLEYTPKDFGIAYKDIYLTTSDNVRIHAWYASANKEIFRAVALISHGNAGNISHRIEIIQMFHELGIDVFIYDYRGYGQSKGQPSEKGTYLDEEAAYNYLIHDKKINPDKIILFGKSLGAAIAIDLAAKQEKIILISDSAFTSTYDMAKIYFPFLAKKWLISINYDSFSKIDQVQGPKLFIHSKHDEIVPYSLGEKLYNKAKEPKKFRSLPHGGHNEAFSMHTQEISNIIDEFLKEYGI